MSKLNLTCLQKLIDSLSYEDYIKLKESLQDKVFIITDNKIKKTYTIPAKDQNDLLDKMLLLKLPELNTYFSRCNGDHDTYIEILDPNSPLNLLICYICEDDNMPYSLCDHSKRNICYLKRSELSKDEIKKIINNMIKYKRIEIKEAKFGNIKNFESLKFI
jgi:hypothetical protein